MDLLGFFNMALLVVEFDSPVLGLLKVQASESCRNGKQQHLSYKLQTSVCKQPKNVNVNHYEFSANILLELHRGTSRNA